MPDLSRPPAANGERDLPEEIVKAIEELEAEAELYGEGCGYRYDIAKAREALTAAILSRLGEAEAANGRIAVENIHLAARYAAADRALVAALARVEKLEKALEAVVRLLEDGGDVRPGGPTPAKALDALWNRAALTEAQPKGDQ